MNFIKQFYDRYLVITISLLYFLLNTVPLIRQPLHGDEVWFGLFSHIPEHNFQISYLGEGHKISEWFIHPHFYYYILRSIVSLTSIDYVRLASVLVGVASIYVFYRILLITISKKTIVNLGMILLTMNPLFIQGSLVLDMDNTLVAFSILLLTYFWLINKNIDTVKENPATFLLTIVIMFWSKFVAAIMLMPSVFLYYLIKDRSSLLRATVLLITGFFIFMATWFLYTKIIDGNFTGLLTYAFLSGSQELKHSPSILFDFIKKFLTFIIWFNPLLFILFTYLIFKNRLFVSEKLFLQVLIIYICLVVSSVVASLPGGFPRYWSSVGPLIILLITIALDRVRPFKFSTKDYFLGFTAAIIIVISGNIFETLWKLKYWSIGISKLNFYDLVPLLTFFLIALMGTIYLKKQYINLTIILIIASAAAVNFQNLTQIEASNYNYGEKGFNDVVKFAKTINIQPENMIIREDLAFYTLTYGQLDSYKHSTAWLAANLERNSDVTKLFKDENIKLFIWRDMDYFSYGHIINEPKLKKALIDYSYRRIGNFQVWFKN